MRRILSFSSFAIVMGIGWIWSVLPDHGFAQVPTTGAESRLPIDQTGGAAPDWAVDYFGLFVGPSFGNWSSYLSDSEGKKSPMPVFLVNELAFGVKRGPLKTQFKLGWSMRPETSSPFAREFEWDDPGVSISHSRLIQIPGLHFYANLTNPIPVTEASRKKRLIAAPASFQMARYRLGSSRFSLNAMNKVQFYFYESGSKRRDAKIEFQPGLGYRLADRVSLLLMHRWHREHQAGDPFLRWKDRGTYWSVAALWRPWNGSMLMPEVYFYDVTRLNLKTTAFNLMLRTEIL